MVVEEVRLVLQRPALEVAEEALTVHHYLAWVEVAAPNQMLQGRVAYLGQAFEVCCPWRTKAWEVPWCRTE